jgi:1-acyl-sn-glycerol-3-phosphate acyltransferase
MARGDRRSSLLLYRVVRAVLHFGLKPILTVRSAGSELLDQPGAVILAPVHRSHLDSVLIATRCRRRIRALGKESLFTTPVVGYVCAALGAIPVQRGRADRDALKAAGELLEREEALIVFPEGGRQSGGQVATLFDGAAWLSARTGAPVVPIGVAGTEEALPTGSWRLHRSKVGIVVGAPLDPLIGEGGKRPNRAAIRSYTARLADRLQAAQDEAIALAK